MDYASASARVVENGKAEGRAFWPLGMFVEARAVDNISSGRLEVVGSAFRWPTDSLNTFAQAGDESLTFFGPRSWPNPELDGDWGTGRIMVGNVHHFVGDYSLKDKWVRTYLGEPNVTFVEELQRFYAKAFGTGAFSMGQKTKINAVLRAGAIPKMEITGEPQWDAIAIEMQAALDLYIAGAVEQGKANLEMLRKRVAFWEGVHAVAKEIQGLPTTIAKGGLMGLWAMAKANPAVTIGVALAAFVILAPRLKTAKGLLKGVKP